MRPSYPGSPGTEDSPIPKLYDFLGFKVYFWASDGDEPVHVRVSKGKPTANSTKIWLTAAGGCIVARNTPGLTRGELSLVCEFVAAEHSRICKAWETQLRAEVRFYC